jgi:hypothetical protein
MRVTTTTMTSEALASEWQSRSIESGWAFPADWSVAAIDAVCDAICADQDVWPAAERLGQARAATGISLGETLADIDVLCALSPSKYTSVLRRSTSLGWADRITSPPSTVSNPISGLVTPEYLQVRLGEVYRAGEVRDQKTGEVAALVVVRLDLTRRVGWQRALPMILTGDCMRTVFNGGQTLAQLGESVAVALAERNEVLARRARLLASMITSHVEGDPQAKIPPPKVWIESLPSSYGAALDLVSELSR